MKSVKKIKKIIELEAANKHANDLFTDIKAEVVAANLIEQGYDPDYIVVTREGISRRNWNKDVDNLYVAFSQFDLKDYLYIKSNRASIYDILPEGIFHSSVDNKRINRDKEDIIEEIRFHRKEEFFARRFFQLFEIEIDSAAVKAYLYEAKYDKKISNPNFVKLFISYWPIIKLLEREQAIFFLYTIPLLSKIRNQISEISGAMSLILEVPVNIEPFKMLHKNEGSKEFESTLGTTRLGLDWVLGESFDDGLLDLKVTIGPIAGEEMRKYLGDAKGRVILDYLCKLFLPGNVFVKIEYIIVKEDAEFRLSDEQHTSYLGINTFL